MATTRQPRQFLAVWNDAGTEVKGSTFEESLFVDGAFWKNELTSVAPESFGEFGAMFSNQLQIQHDALAAEKTTLLLEKETLQADKTTLESTNATLETQLAEKTEQFETLTEEKATLTEQLAAANARIAALLAEIPFDPRIIDATAFYDRLTKDEVLTLFRSSDATTKQIGETIIAYKANDWPIVFESTEFQQLLGYLMQSGTLTEARMEELTRDATRTEAYSAE